MFLRVSDFFPWKKIFPIVIIFPSSLLLSRNTCYLLQSYSGVLWVRNMLSMAYSSKIFLENIQEHMTKIFSDLTSHSSDPDQDFMNMNSRLEDPPVVWYCKTKECENTNVEVICCTEELPFFICLELIFRTLHRHKTVVFPIMRNHSLLSNYGEYLPLSIPVKAGITLSLYLPQSYSTCSRCSKMVGSL